MSISKQQAIMLTYRDTRATYLRLERLVTEQITGALRQASMRVMSIEHRTKTISSLEAKIARKGDKYADIREVTDLVGIRIVCYFSDDVDRIANLIGSLFQIDQAASVDKRALLSTTSFGYLSLHCICSLKEDGTWPEELYGIRFEVQIRSVLQHVWAEIEHDLGYKSEFGVPRTVRREFSRVAGLLEIADEYFVSIRDKVESYTTDIRQKIADNTADDLPIDRISLREYMLHNSRMRDFLRRLSDLCSAAVVDADPDTYVQQLDWLGMTTLGELSAMVDANANQALILAGEALQYTDMDSLTSTAALRYLCQAELIRKHYTCAQMEDFLRLSLKDPARAAARARRLSARQENAEN